MNDVVTFLEHANANLSEVWARSGALLVTVAGAGLLLLIALLLWSKIGKHPIRPTLIWLGSNLALLLNAEGMWVVATETLHLSAGFAVLVFAVFEVALTVGQALSTERYRATSVRDNAGKLITPGHPGKMLYVVWLIALTSGLVVATNAGTRTEQILRFALPVIVIALWWATLTAEGQARPRGKFAHSPTRLAERWGLLVPDEDPDWERMARERRQRALVAYGYRLRAGTRGAWLWQWRLIRLARVADEDLLCAAEDQVVRLAGITDRFVGVLTQPELPPAGGGEEPAELPGGTSGRNHNRKPSGSADRKLGRKPTGRTAPRRSAAQTRKLVAELRAQDPSLTQEALATKLRISARQLRNVLNGAGADESEYAQPNGHDPTTTSTT